jgi:hypothetical protein
MQNMDLFGINIGQQRTTAKEQKQMADSVLSDLVNLAFEIDSKGISSDYRKRKSYQYYDPYSPEANQSTASLLRWDGENNLRASLVVAHFREQLKHITSEMKEMSFID